MSLATLFLKLQEHKIELMRLNQHEENDKKNKEIALKASSSNPKESDREDLNELEEDDDFSFFIKRFNKFLRNKRNKKEQISIQRKKEKTLCHTLILSGDHCLMACNLRLIALRDLTPIVKQSAKFRDMPGVERKHYCAICKVS